MENIYEGIVEEISRIVIVSEVQMFFGNLELDRLKVRIMEEKSSGCN